MPACDPNVGHRCFLKEGTDHAKLILRPERTEPLDFTVEAMVNLDSVYPTGAVRTIASRWDGNPTTFGWAVGITSSQSRFEPSMLIVQAVGGDFQAAMTSEVLNSGLKVPSGKPYYISVTFSTGTLPGNDYGGHIIFRTKDLSDPDAKMHVSKVPHALGSEYVNPEKDLLLGARDGQTGNNWFGAIHRFALSEGPAPADAEPFASKLPGLFSLTGSDFSSSENKKFSWVTYKDPAAESKNPAKVEALGDLFHALINSNEFLYLP